MAYALFADMYATLIQIAGTLSLAWTPESFYSMRMSTLNPQVEFDRVRACYDRLTELRGDESAESGAANSTLEMEQYIREHYANSSLSVTFMAEQFRVSESYFSEYFKRSTGQTFSAFLETTRINSACATLRRTDRTNKTIEEIAEDTGYTNALSFRRAFKKVTGVSPSDYRKGISGID
jgi:YesN/AraC family two-component response regulator